MKKKQKVIHLSEQAIESLSVMAIRFKSNFKNYVENHLELFAEGLKDQGIVKDVRKKNKK